MDNYEFREWAHRLADWMADYYKAVDTYPVKPLVNPGDILDRIPLLPPEIGESMDDIIRDVDKIILPGMTHWQSPNFFAYFPANASYPSILAEMITAAIGAQCMIWETSPAATELEERMMDWLKTMAGLPQQWAGVIQDTASTSTLAALLTAREKSSHWKINESGAVESEKYRVYVSTETHSSVEKAVKIAGIGRRNLVKVPVDSQYRMEPSALSAAIESDIAAGFTPLFVVATLGTTGCTAIDPLSEIAYISKKYNLWLHVDAAYAGTALLLPEYRRMIDGIENVDSFVFNPHKWMFTNFDCSAYFVKDRDALIRTFDIYPEYLRTASRGRVNDYRDWGIPLGRRFRSLKLWFVIRSFGWEGLQAKIRQHIEIAKGFEALVNNSDEFEMLAARHFSLVCFRYHPCGISDEGELSTLNEKLLEFVNRSGKAYITHTKLSGQYTLRASFSQTYIQPENATFLWSLLNEYKNHLK